MLSIWRPRIFTLTFLRARVEMKHFPDEPDNMVALTYWEHTVEYHSYWSP